ncbi:hypothetical protein VTN77DRAFT_6890 [Rasamsonia byssochlamydoides]|uniref:uncharacterized protein n=1 Tax=Rasamsonia byssochlamydoides TaxID=89139 RepID=UPI003742A7FE
MCRLTWNTRYVAQGQIDKARDILVRYHGDGNPRSKVAELELEEMQEVISREGSDKRFWDFRGLFNSREDRHRTFLVTCIAWFGQLDLPPTSYYFPLMGRYPLLADTLPRLTRTASQNRRHHRQQNTAPAQRDPDAHHDGGRAVWPALYPPLRSP